VGAAQWLDLTVEEGHRSSVGMTRSTPSSRCSLHLLSYLPLADVNQTCLTGLLECHLLPKEIINRQNGCSWEVASVLFRLSIYLYQENKEAYYAR
jgi:hypothetical protein